MVSLVGNRSHKSIIRKLSRGEGEGKREKGEREKREKGDKGSDREGINIHCEV
jgi:hypothetical protein